MNDETLDHILGSEEELLPSSGFAASVMDRVREQAAAPPPIAFPWKRAVPGIALAAAVVGWGAVEFVRHGTAAAQTLAPVHLNAAVLQPLESAGWVALALSLSLASWLLSRRLAGESGLL